MSFPGRLVSDDESIVFDVRHHFAVLWRPVLAELIYIVVWLLLVISFDFFGHGYVFLLGFLVWACLFLFCAWRILLWSRAHLVLTNFRLIYGSGVLARHTRETTLAQITDVSILQSVPGRVLGFGDLLVQSSTESGPVPYFGMPDPHGLKSKIQEQMRAGAGRAGAADPEALAHEVARAVSSAQPTREVVALPPERPPLYSEIVDQIERLDAMRVRGVLSDEEFERAKKGLIDRLSSEPEG